MNNNNLGEDNDEAAKKGALNTKRDHSTNTVSGKTRRLSTRQRLSRLLGLKKKSTKNKSKEGSCDHIRTSTPNISNGHHSSNQHYSSNGHHSYSSSSNVIKSSASSYRNRTFSLTTASMSSSGASNGSDDDDSNSDDEGSHSSSSIEYILSEENASEYYDDGDDDNIDSSSSTSTLSSYYSSDDEREDPNVNGHRHRPISWRSWFLSLPGHRRLLLRIPDEFLEDEFNYNDLISEIPTFRRHLSLILGAALQEDHELEEEEKKRDSSSPSETYVLLHARYLLTKQGLIQMARRYSRGVFGVCSRYYCYRERLVPIGLSDLPGQARVQRYCPSCNDVYHWTSEKYFGVDGAAFGSSFPHFFFLSFPGLIRGDNKRKSSCSSSPSSPICKLPQLKVYEPKIYGFQLLERRKKDIIGSGDDNANGNCIFVDKYNLRSLPNYHRCL